MVYKLGALAGSFGLFYWREDGKEQLITTPPVLTAHKRYLRYKWRDAVGARQ